MSDTENCDRDAPGAVGLAPRRLHPASPFIGLIFQARQYAIPLVATFFLGRDSEIQSLIFLGLPVVIALLQYLGWRRFEYRIEGGALIVDKGVLNRHHREIPIDRVHHIEEIAKLQHRVFGVVNLKIDSGGGESGAEIDLDALSKSEAARLRAFLEGRPDAPGPIIRAAPDAERPVLSIGPLQLVVAGLTNVPFAATIALLASVLQLADEVSEDFIVAVVERVPLTVAGLAGSLLTVALVYVAFAGGASVLSNYGFVLQRDGNEVRVQKGLLDRRRSVVDLRKLTVIRIDETIMRRALRLCSFRLQTISGGGGPFGVSTLSVPILGDSEVDRVVAELMPVAAPLPTLEVHPPAARRRIYVRRLFIGLVLAVPIGWFWRPAGVLVAVLLLVLAACRAEVAYRALGHGTRDSVLISREGGLRRTTALTTWPRAESTRLRSSPLQRWAGLATLYVDVPQGRSVAVVDADPAELRELRKLAITR